MVIGIDASRAFLEERTGTENYSYQLIKALIKIDRSNRYILYTRTTKTVDFPLPPNVSLKEISWPRLWTQAGLALECLINPPDVLFVPAHTLPVIHRPGLKTVVTIHDLGSEYLPQYHQFPQKYYLNWSTIYAVKYATRIIAVSKSTQNDIVSKLHIDRLKIRLIYEGVNTEKFKLSDAKGQLSDVLKKYNITKPYILFVGTVQPRKNLYRLIEAFSILCHPERSEGSHPVSRDSSSRLRRTQNDIELIIVGKPGWMYDEIYQAPKKFGIEDRVKFLGFVADKDMPVIYKEAEVFCLPSLFEGFGLPVLEAMLQGVPVVVSNTSSLPEVVGDAGVLVDPADSSEIAKGILSVLENESFRKTLIKKGRERIKQFSWEKTARETLQVLEETQRK